MKAKSTRNLIITLVIIAVGIKLLLAISGYYISRAGAVGQFTQLLQPFESLGNYAIYGIAIIAILLVPYYLSKRSEEKKLQ